MANIKFDKILGDIRENDNAGFEFTQAVPAFVWNVVHTLNKKPSITITDGDGDVVEGQEIYINDNQVDLHFEVLFSGKAYLT